MKMKIIFFAIISGVIVILLLFWNRHLNRQQANLGDLILNQDSAVLYWLSPDPDSDLMTPYWELSPERQKIFDAKRELIDQRVQGLFGDSYNYYLAYEFRNQIFHQTFPETHLYVVEYDNGDVCPEAPCLTTYQLIMASRRGIDYRMPQEFYQLAIDSNYQLTEENQNLLAHALIIVALPLEMTQQSISCGEGYSTDKYYGDKKSGYHYVYAIDCQTEYITYDPYCLAGAADTIDCETENLTDVTAWFSELAPSKRSHPDYISWGNMTEDGWRESGIFVNH